MNEIISPEINKEVLPEVNLPRHMSKLSLKLVTIFLLILVIPGAVFAGVQIGKRQKPQTPSEILFNQSITEITPTVDPVAGWQTYTDTSGNYSLLYPSGWKLKTSNTLVQFFNYDVDKAPGRAYDPSIDGDLFKIEIYSDNDYSDVDKWFNEEKKSISPVTDKLINILNEKRVSIGGQKGWFYEIKDEMSGLRTGSVHIENPKGGIIHLWGGLNYEGNKETFDQILATFKFLDSSQISAVRSSCLFNLLTAKAGDKVCNMIISSIEPYSMTLQPPVDEKLSSYNAKISFSGSTAIEGEYYYSKSPFYGSYILGFKVSENSCPNLPFSKEEDFTNCSKGYLHTEFSNEKTAMKLLGITEGVEGRGTVKATVKNYTINHYPSEVSNAFELLSVN